MAKSKPTGLANRFSLAGDEMRHRTIATIDGEVGVGKTFFCLTAPGPILVQNIDQGTEGVIEQFVKDGKEIYEEKYIWLPGDPDEEDDDKKAKALQDAAKEIRDKWEKDFTYALDNGIRSVIFDTESRIWQVFRYAEFGAPNAGSPRDYDELNQRFEAMVNKAKASDINLFLIRSMKDQWGLFGKPNAQGKKSFAKGGREVWGYEHLPGLVFTELSFFMDKDADVSQGEEPYKIRFGKCRHNADLQFTVVDRCTFPELGTQMIPGSDESDWS